MSVRITSISKPHLAKGDAHVAIQSLGWINEDTQKTGTSSRLEMYDWIKQGGLAYVRDEYGNQVDVKTAETSSGTKYVRTRKDRVWTDNLLALLNYASA